MSEPMRSPLHPTDLQAIGQLAVDGVIGVTDLVEQLHAAIAGTVTGTSNAQAPGRTGGVTGLVYRSVRSITRQVGTGLGLAFGTLARVLPPGAPAPVRDDLVAALNGVLGDHLAATGNPLAIPMRVVHAGRPLAFDASLPEALRPEPELVVFLHGLCLHPGHWTPGAAGELEALPARLAAGPGRTVVQLHYNSGHAIHQNGAELATLLDELEAHWPVPIERIALVGHSMGGLVARSAAHHGTEAGHRWVDRLGHLVTLGSPHHGAPLERAGHRLEQLIALSRYSRPFTRLGRMRSAGILDLRHGRITADASAPNLPDHTRMLLVAADRSVEGRASPLGDGLVPVESALAHGTLDAHPELQRHQVQGCGHLALMHHAEVADRVEDWIGGAPGR